MAKINIGKGIKEYTRQLTELHNVSATMIAEVVDEGAFIVADAMRAEINALPVAQKYAKDGEKISTITSVQKKGLQDGFGISPLQDRNGFKNRKLGFDGYNGQKTSKYKHGVPNSVVARSVVSGTSFRNKNDFVSRAVRRTEKQAEKQMQTKLEEMTKQIF